MQQYVLHVCWPDTSWPYPGLMVRHEAHFSLIYISSLSPCIFSVSMSIDTVLPFTIATVWGECLASDLWWWHLLTPPTPPSPPPKNYFKLWHQPLVSIDNTPLASFVTRHLVSLWPASRLTSLAKDSSATWIQLCSFIHLYLLPDMLRRGDGELTHNWMHRWFRGWNKLSHTTNAQLGKDSCTWSVAPVSWRLLGLFWDSIAVVFLGKRDCQAGWFMAEKVVIWNKNRSSL